MEKSRFAGAFSGNYFRVYVPEFDTILHLSTTVSPERQKGGSADPAQTFLRRLTLSRWRAYPYLRRVRNTGDAHSLSIQRLDPVASPFMMTHLASLPSQEALIADAGQFAAFNVNGILGPRVTIRLAELSSRLWKCEPLWTDTYPAPRFLLETSLVSPPSYYLNSMTSSGGAGSCGDSTRVSGLRSFFRTRCGRLGEASVSRFDFRIEPFHRIELISAGEERSWPRLAW